MIALEVAAVVEALVGGVEAGLEAAAGQAARGRCRLSPLANRSAITK